MADKQRGEFMTVVYQGMTLGYRVLYAYFPENGAVIVVGLNSQPDEKQNHNGALHQIPQSSIEVMKVRPMGRM